MDQFIPVIIVGLILACIAGIYFLVIKKKPSDSTEVPTTPSEPAEPHTEPVKKAVLVGLNKTHIPGTELSGCVNDVEDVWNLLVNQYGFDPDNIRVLTDERATKQAILDRLVWLVDKSIPGDELVFHYSGHGSQVRDRNGDELNDQLDEILIPYDVDFDDPLTDDMIGEVFKGLAQGAYLTMICDSCHSGTMSKSIRNELESRIGRKVNGKHAYRKSINAPFDVRMRAANRDLSLNKMGVKQKGNGQRHVLLSGCADDQTSADAYISALAEYRGALTYTFTTVARGNPNGTWHAVHEEVLEIIADDYTQEPQLTGDSNLTDRKIFGGAV
jgi:hypothetical protein